MQSVFRWGGQYFGFEHGGAIYDATGRPVAMIVAGAVWRLDGSYLGEWVGEGYILRPTATDRPLRVSPRIPPPCPPLPPRPIARPSRPNKAGWTDPLRRLCAQRD